MQQSCFLVLAPIGYFIVILLFKTDNLGVLSTSQTLSICTVIIFFIYVPVLESSKYQGTLGQILMKIKIVNLQGERISFIDSFVRLIVFFIFNAVYLWIISLFTIFFTKEKKALHDMACKTRVVIRSNS